MLSELERGHRCFQLLFGIDRMGLKSGCGIVLNCSVQEFCNSGARPLDVRAHSSLWILECEKWLQTSRGS